MYLFLTKRYAQFGEGKILHVAPEKELQRILRHRYATRYTSLDIASPRADIRADVQSIPFKDGSFRTAICSHVLEHVPDDARAMREFFRVLEDGGLAILQVPFSPTLDCTFEDPSIVSPELRMEHFGQSDHVRIYGKDYADRLRAVGFDVTLIYPKDLLAGEEVRRYALNEREPLFVCRKPA